MFLSSARLIFNTHQIDTRNIRYFKVLSSTSYQQVAQIKSEDTIKNDYHCTLDEWNNAKPFRSVPGPKPLPVIGNTWRFLPKIGEFSFLTKDITEVFQKIQRSFGNIVVLDKIIGLHPMVLLFNPGDIEMIYKLEGTLPDRENLKSIVHFRENFRQDIFQHSRGLVSQDTHEWYDFRNKVNPIMMQPKMIKQYVRPVDDIAKEFVRRIKSIRGSDNRIKADLWNESNKWSLESIAYMAMNTKLGCLEDDLPDDSLPARMIRITDDVFTLSGKLDLQPSIWKWVATPTYKKAMKAYNAQAEISQSLIEKAIERIKEKSESTNKDGDEEPSVLEKLLKIDKNVAIIMTLDMLLAGVDTTSIAFLNALYYLAINKSKQEKLREEVVSVLPNHNSEVTAEILNSMPYLKACVKEAARIYSTTLGSMRILTKNAVISGYQIPKRSHVMFLHMIISQNEEQFIRPKEYLPERWLRENVGSDISYKNAHPFTSMQFGFGARSCIGRRFAELELEVALTNFIRNFDISWEGPSPRRKASILNYFVGPYRFVFADVKK